MLLLLTVCVLKSAGCISRPIVVPILNYNDQEMFVLNKEGKEYKCLSTYYIDKIEQIKIDLIKPGK